MQIKSVLGNWLFGFYVAAGLSHSVIITTLRDKLGLLPLTKSGPDTLTPSIPQLTTAAPQSSASTARSGSLWPQPWERKLILRIFSMNQDWVRGQSVSVANLGLTPNAFRYLPSNVDGSNYTRLVNSAVRFGKPHGPLNYSSLSCTLNDKGDVFRTLYFTTDVARSNRLVDQSQNLPTGSLNAAQSFKYAQQERWWIKTSFISRHTTGHDNLVLESKKLLTSDGSDTGSTDKNLWLSTFNSGTNKVDLSKSLKHALINNFNTFEESHEFVVKRYMFLLNHNILTTSKSMGMVTDDVRAHTNSTTVSNPPHKRFNGPTCCVINGIAYVTPVTGPENESVYDPFKTWVTSDDSSWSDGTLQNLPQTEARKPKAYTLSVKTNEVLVTNTCSSYLLTGVKAKANLPRPSQTKYQLYSAGYQPVRALDNSLEGLGKDNVPSGQA